MISVLVVTYNSDALSSKTINGFLNSNLFFEDVNLVVWNNGPHLYDSFDLSVLSEKGITVFLHQTIENKPLSHVYNEFISQYNSDYYVVLDHDSNLNDEYLGYISSIGKAIFLGMPRISYKNIPCSPCVNNKYTDGPYNSTDKLTAIGSGLVLSQNLVDVIKQRFGNVFDENYALYGVDTSLFYRIQKLGYTYKCIIIPGFEHSLSRLENEMGSIKLFRIKERSIDLGLTIRHYPNKCAIKLFMIEIFKMIFGNNSLSIFFIIKAMIAGKHPRC